MLRIKDLMVFYENMVAINNVSMKCEEGQIVGVFGANSAGKSTLCYAISGIILDIMKKEEMAGGERISVIGHIEYKGSDITKEKPSRRSKNGIILCPERRRIFPESSVLENLRIGGYLASSSQAKATLQYVFEAFPPLEKLRKREGGFLSGGEQQMLAVARGVMAEPEVLMFDELSLGLAPVLVLQLFETLQQLKASGLTMLLVEQNVHMALSISDDAYVLTEGAITLSGTAAEVAGHEGVRESYLGV